MSAQRITLNAETVVAAVGDAYPAEQVDAALRLLADGEGRFPSGVRKLPAGLVRAVQRERVLAAMLRSASELGYRNTNVQDVIERAGVSRPTFYEHFANKDDCFLAAFDTGVERLWARLDAAARDGDGDRTWRGRIRRAMAALLAFAGDDRDAAQTIVVEARGGSDDALARRERLLDDLARRLEAQARAGSPPPETPSPTASAVVGGIESILYSRLCRNEIDGLGELLPSLMYFAVLPYEGHAAAREELARTEPAVTGSA